MEFEHLKTVSLELEPEWIFHSAMRDAFIVGGRDRSYAIAANESAAPELLAPFHRVDHQSFPHHPCDLPVPLDVYEEFAAATWHGFRFLSPSDYAVEVDGKDRTFDSVLSTIIAGPDYGTYLEHPASGLVLSLRSGGMQLLRRTDSGFAVIDETRTRGRAALAFAAHPTETKIAYGDNYGTFHLHEFSETGFGKARKIDAASRKTSRIEFVDGGQTLLIGGMGYLNAYTWQRGKFTKAHEESLAVRDFTWSGDSRMVVVNKGIHGLSVFRYDADGLTNIGNVATDASVNCLAIASDARICAVTPQHANATTLYRIADS